MRKIRIAFRFLCLIATIGMCIHCTYEFSKNKDLTEISTATFNKGNGMMYPQLGLCIENQFLEGELKKLGEGVNASSYRLFLEGKLWNDRMVNVSIETITINLEDHILRSCVASSYGENCDDKGEISSRILPWGLKCLFFHYKNPEQITFAKILVKPSIFVNGIFPTQGFYLLLGYPNQMLRSPASFQIPARFENFSKSCELDWELTEAQAVRRRNKPELECSELKNYDYDSLIEEEILSSVGCRPFYLERFRKYPSCDAKPKMAKIYKDYLGLKSDPQNSEHFTPPCSEFEKLLLAHSHHDIENRNGERYFSFQVNFRKKTYREFVQIRAYNLQSLIGNAGGYVGLFIGYSIAELPVLLETVYMMIRKVVNYI